MSKRRRSSYETRREPLAGPGAFGRRLAWNVAVAAVLISVSLLAGMVGYHWFEGMDWLDAFVNAAMILSGMGPLDPLKTSAGKLFAGTYALFCGFALVAAIGIVAAPIVHRLLHRFHVDDAADDQAEMRAR